MHQMQGRSIDADVKMRPKSAVEKEWEAEAKQLLKAELARQGVTCVTEHGPGSRFVM